jgi:hypothetical protein
MTRYIPGVSIPELWPLPARQWYTAPRLVPLSVSPEEAERCQLVMRDVPAILDRRPLVLYRPLI